MRRRLKYGAFSIFEQPEAEAIEAMSLYLRKLETNPSLSASDVTTIPKLLNKMKNMDLPSDFKIRAVKLLENKIEASFVKEDLITSNVNQPINNRDIEFNTLKDKDKSMDTLSSQEVLDSIAKTSATALSEKLPSKMTVRSEQTPRDHDFDFSSSAQEEGSSGGVSNFPQSTPESQAIDLTGGIEEDSDIASEPPRQLRGHPGIGTSAGKSTHVTKSPLQSSKSKFHSQYIQTVQNVVTDSDLFSL